MLKLKLILFDVDTYPDTRDGLVEILNKEGEYTNTKYFGVTILNLGEKVKVIDLWNVSFVLRNLPIKGLLPNIAVLLAEAMPGTKRIKLGETILRSNCQALR